MRGFLGQACALARQRPVATGELTETGEDITNPLSAPAFIAAVDSVDTTVDVDDGNRIQVHLVVGLQGDTTTHRISYQTNILLQKAS